jgi:dephospho-CoA kinase
MLHVGLTGGIATGKSRVLAAFAARGLHTIDLDRLGHLVIEPGRPAHAEIVQAFGKDVVAADGQIDRRALGALVFTSALARKTLNAIVHPRIFEEEMRLVATLPRSPRAVVVTDATLLVESGHHIRFDRLVVTSCERRQQLGRLMHRDGLSAGAAQARIASQMDGAEKAGYAHHVIDTTGGLEDTDAAAGALADALLVLAERWPLPAPIDPGRAVACLLRGPQSGPRGLTPQSLLTEIVRAGVPPLAALPARLVPPQSGPWYECGRSDVAGPGPESLMGPLVLWSRAWHGPDREALVAAALSLAKLTHSAPAALAAALSFALALAEVVDGGAVPSDLDDRVAAHAALVTRWAGAAPVPICAPSLRAALQGLAEGLDPAAAPSPLAEAVQALASRPPQR